jgi:hypothetical protein
MNLVGLGLNLPEVGACTDGDSAQAAVPLSETARVEFVDAGEVSLQVGGSRNRLVPYNFPTVTDSISGVLYTSRDRQADLLLADTDYQVSADGFSLTATDRAPAALDGVTASGVPLTEVTSLSTRQPLDLTWNVGASDDIVYVEVTNLDNSLRTVCSFADDVGAGTVPLAAFAPGQQGRVALHRVRLYGFGFAGQGASQGELRFDFALSASVQFD